MIKVLAATAFVVVTAAACDLAPPFEGPGYSLDDGLTSDAEGPFVVGTTLLVLNDDPDAQKHFDEHMAAIRDVIDDQKGLVGKSLAIGIGKPGYRTLTVWESEADMLGWVVSDVHAAAMDDMVDYSASGSVASWTMTREELEAAAPTWDEAREHLDADGTAAY